VSATLEPAPASHLDDSFPLLTMEERDGELRSRAWVTSIDRAWRAGARGVFFAAPHFEGRGDFGALIAHAVGRGLDTGWVSDGRGFSDPNYVKRLVDRARLRAVHLRGRELAPQELEEARQSLLESGVNVRTSHELSDQSPVVASESLAAHSDAFWTWNPARPETARPEELLASIRELDVSLESRVVGFPSCLSRQGELLHRIFEEAQAFDGLGEVEAERVLPPACAGCALDMDCLGIPAGWFRAHGDDGLSPFMPVDEARPWAPIPAGDISAFRPTERPRLDIAPRYPDTALITLMVAGCDLSCIFCDTPQEGMSIRFSSRASVRASLAAMSGTCSSVLFTGGEPSRLSWLTEIFEDARELGYEFIQMQSHAGAAADPAVADAWIAAGLDAIDIPIYGADAESHEAVTRTPGSFENTLAGLANLRQRGAKSVMHTTLFNSNLSELEAIVRKIDSLAPDGAYIQITGEVGAPGTYDRVAPAPERVGAALIDAFAAVTPETPIHLSDVTPCLVAGLEEQVISWRRTSGTPARPVVLPYSEWLMVFSGGRTKGHHAVCDTCALRNECDGLPLESLARFGGVGLVPR
jgi:pyruvate-formate lyase-activating enzyme